MLAYDIYFRKTRSGNVRKIVRERYLRDDIGCSLRNCSLCNDNVIQSSSNSTDVIIIDSSVALNEIDILEEDIFPSLIIPQTVLDESKRRSPPVFKRLSDILANSNRQAYYFANEFHKDTFDARQPGESIDQRNARAVRFCVEWYTKHLATSGIKVLLCSNDLDMQKHCKEDASNCLSMREYVQSLPNSAELVDKLSACKNSDDSCQIIGRGILFPVHLTLSAINIGLKSGKLKYGSIQISRENYLEANVFVEGLEEPVFIQGLINLNRAIHDDIVAIEILPKDEWTAPAALLKVLEMETQTDLGDEILLEEDQLLKDAVPTERNLIDHVLPTGRVVGIVRRNWRPYCGMLQRSFVPSSVRHLFLPNERRIPKIRIETRQAEILYDQRIIVSIDSWPRYARYPQGHFVRALGPVGDHATENEVLLLEHDVPHHKFSIAVLACLPELPWNITPLDIKEREDLRHLDICSVDPPGCTDIDDALHCRQLSKKIFECGVHIADVSHFVRPLTAMDKEAAQRGTTVYLVDRRIDMLPDLLSSNLCSLRGGEERFAFSVIWEMNFKGKILKCRFCKSIIKSRKAFTYDEAQIMIDDSSNNGSLAKSLRLLNEIAKKLKEKRKAKGALTLASLEIRFRIDTETHDPIDVQSKQLLETNSMVEEFMLLANISVAEKLCMEFPDCAVLRRHPIPAPSNYKPIMDAAAQRGLKITVDSGKALSDSLDGAQLPDNPYFNTMLRILTTRCMTQAKYFCSGTLEKSLYFHFGLAAPVYTHFTSPIRRYADILVHRLLAAALGCDNSYPELLNKQKIQAICNNLNYRHKMAQWAARASVLLNTHLFFRDRQEQLQAYVLSVRRNAIQVLIPKYGLESAIVLPSCNSPFAFDVDTGTLHAGDVMLQMFSKIVVQVNVDRRDIQHEKLSLSLVEPYVPGFSVEPLLSAPETESEPPSKRIKLE